MRPQDCYARDSEHDVCKVTGQPIHPAGCTECACPVEAYYAALRWLGHDGLARLAQELLDDEAAQHTPWPTDIWLTRREEVAPAIGDTGKCTAIAGCLAANAGLDLMREGWWLAIRHIRGRLREVSDDVS